MKELNKINNELKSYINEANFISTKCRDKIVKLLGEEFGIVFKLDNYANVDVKILEDGSIEMRGDVYKTSCDIKSMSDIEEKYNKFKLQADAILKKKEINYYNMNDKNNIINVFILIVMIGLFLALLYYAFISFINGNFFGCIWVVAYSSSLFVPGIKERLTQAVNFIKRKMK